MHLSSLTPPSCEESEMGRYFDTQWPRNLFRAVHYSILEQGLFHDNNDLDDLIAYPQFFGLQTPLVIYIESFARVKSLSLSGKLIRPLADR